MSTSSSSVPKAPSGSFPPLLRLLDAYFTSLYPLPQKQTCLNMLSLYAKNIFMNPEEAKFRSIKASNVRFHKEVLQCPGGDLVLLAIGFERKVRDFEEYFVLPPTVDISVDYWRIKKYKELMDHAIAEDKNAPVNRLRAEKEARESAVRQIEEDARRRKEKGRRGKMGGDVLSSGHVPREIDSNSSAMRHAKDAAIARQRALAAPIVAAKTMLPTPSLSHLTEDDYDKVYEPAEDSFALLDALQNDIDLLQTIAEYPLVLEIGSGTGIVSAFLQQSILTQSLHFCTDINQFACDTTLQTSALNVQSSLTSLDATRASLTDGLRLRDVDLIVFNPPYVPTASSEINTDGAIAAAWAGGEDGMDVTAQFLRQAASLLSERGLFYLVTVARNKPDEIISQATGLGLVGRAVLDRRAGREKLVILRFHKVARMQERTATAIDALSSLNITQASNYEDTLQTETRRIDGQDPNLFEDPTMVGTLD